MEKTKEYIKLILDSNSTFNGTILDSTDFDEVIEELTNNLSISDKQIDEVFEKYSTMSCTDVIIEDSLFDTVASELANTVMNNTLSHEQLMVVQAVDEYIRLFNVVAKNRKQDTEKWQAIKTFSAYINGACSFGNPLPENHKYYGFLNLNFKTTALIENLLKYSNTIK